MKSTKQVLEEAAEIIERGGACAGLFALEGGHCAIGAVRAATTGHPLVGNGETATALRQVNAYIPTARISTWNDSRPPHSRTPEVAALLRYAADPCRWEHPEVSP